jgi:hypothetical protein
VEGVSAMKFKDLSFGQFYRFPGDRFVYRFICWKGKKLKWFTRQAFHPGSTPSISTFFSEWYKNFDIEIVEPCKICKDKLFVGHYNPWLEEKRCGCMK